MEVTYRPARVEDLPAMVDVFLASLVDMHARHRVATQPAPREVVLPAYEHILRTGSFLVAEADGEVAAIAGAVVRDELWYLSAFWTRPALQCRGIGLPLLRALKAEGERAGATTFFTWSSMDQAALASYMKLGMLPGYPILVFEGAPKQLSAVPAGYSTHDLETEDARALDALVRGTRRDPDHDLWAASPRCSGRLVVRDGSVAGYYYLSGPVLGPVAWRSPADAEAVVTAALSDAAARLPAFRIAVPGINHAALRIVVAAGLRLSVTFHFLTSAPFGRLKQYLPSGPSLY